MILQQNLLHLSFQLWCICSTSKRVIALFVLCACLISRHRTCTNIETCWDKFLTFFRADILGGSSCNKPLSDSERPEPSWWGAHSPSQASAAGAEPRGGCLVFLSCCHPVIAADSVCARTAQPLWLHTDTRGALRPVHHTFGHALYYKRNANIDLLRWFMAFGKNQYLRCHHNIALLPSESSVMVAM